MLTVASATASLTASGPFALPSVGCLKLSTPAVRHKDVTENVAKQVGNLPKDKRGKRRTFDYWKTSGHGETQGCQTLISFALSLIGTAMLGLGA